MRIRLSTTLVALLLALCLLSACGTDRSTAFEAKEIAIADIQSVQDPPPADRTLPFGDESRVLVYRYDTPSISGEEWEVFQAEDGTRASFCKKNDSFSITAGLGSTIVDVPKNLKTEEDFLACVQDWVRLLAPDADLSAYDYACTTAYLVKPEGEDSYGESKAANSFYRPQNGNEEIESYLFTYTQMASSHANGFVTENGVTVETDGKGNLLAIRYDCYDTDWAFSITDKELEDAVDAFIEAYEKEKDWRSAGFDILEKHLTIVEGEVQLLVTVDATFTPRNSSLEVAYRDVFSLYVSPKKAE